MRLFADIIGRRRKNRKKRALFLHKFAVAIDNTWLAVKGGQLSVHEYSYFTATDVLWKMFWGGCSNDFLHILSEAFSFRGPAKSSEFFQAWAFEGWSFKRIDEMTENGKGNVDWSRFGLDPVGQSSPPRSNNHDPSSLTASGSTASGNPNVKDLFDEEQVKKCQMQILTLSDFESDLCISTRESSRYRDCSRSLSRSKDYHFVDFTQGSCVCIEKRLSR